MDTTKYVSLDPNTFKRGYLYKRAVQGLKKWNRRFFEVSGNYLAYYPDEKDRKDQKIIDISLARAVVPSSNMGASKLVNFISNGEVFDTQYCFEIQSPNETHYLNAPNRKEMDEWLSVLNEIKAKYSRTQSSEITNSHLYNSKNNPHYNSTGNLPTHNNSSNTQVLNLSAPPDISPSRPRQQTPTYGATITLLPLEPPPTTLAFPDLSISFSNLDCTWEKELLMAIQNERETRARLLLEREERLKAALENRPTPVTSSQFQTQTYPSPLKMRPESPTIQTSPPATHKPLPARPPSTSRPPEPTFKVCSYWPGLTNSIQDELFLELINENFDPELIKRAFQLFPITDKNKLKNVSRIFVGVTSNGTPEDLFLEAYNVMKGDVSMVPTYIQSYNKLSEIGFPSDKIKEALLKHNLDYEKSAQWLVT